MSSPNGQHPQQQPVPVGVPVFDPANPFTGDVPTQWTVGKVDFPGAGQRGVACFRTPNTTMAIVLAKDHLGTLIQDLQKLHASMNGLILPG